MADMLSTLRVMMTANSSQLVRETKKANRSLAGLQKQAQFVTSAFKGMLAGFGVTRLGHFISSAVTARDELAKFSKEIGANVESLSAMENALEFSGVGAEEFRKSLERLNRRTGRALQGNKAMADAFKRLGIDLQKFAALKPAQRFEELVRVIANLEDKTKAAGDAQQILGRFGVQAVMRAAADANGVLERYNDNLDNGRFISEEAAKASEELVDSWTSLKQTLIPLADAIVTTTNETVKFWQALVNADDAAGGFKAAMQGVSAELGGVTLATEEQEAHNAAIKSTVEELLRYQEALENGNMSEAARNAILDAQAGAQERLNKLRSEGIAGLGGNKNGAAAVEPPELGSTAITPIDPATEEAAKQAAKSAEKMAKWSQEIAKWENDIAKSRMEGEQSIRQQIDDIQFQNNLLAESDEITRQMMQAIHGNREAWMMLDEETKARYAAQLEGHLRAQQALEAEKEATLELEEQQKQSADKMKEQQEELAEATKKVSDTLASAFSDAIVKGEGLEGVLDNIKGLLLRFASHQMTSGLSGIFQEGGIGDLISGGGIGGSLLSVFGGAALGGPISAGEPKVVGEFGRELFVPDQSGTVMSAGQLDKLASSGSASNVNVTNNFHVVAEGGALSSASQGQMAARVGDQVNRAVRRNR